MKLAARKYKDQLPVKTINRIQNILNNLGILTAETWVDSLEDYHSVHLKAMGTTLYSNGKGTNRKYALASANAEFIERLQNQLLYQRSLTFEPEVHKYKDFYHAPDEKYFSVEEILNSDSNWLNLLIPDNLSQDKQYQLVKMMSSFTPDACEHDFVAIPYYDVNNDQKTYIPFTMIHDYYGTNGMCAGNTPEEALVQGISEVLERYVNKKIVKNEIVPPTIPNQYLKQFPRICEMIDQIEQLGNYRVIMKDCSLEEGFPVVGLILIEENTQRYFVKLGAHPVIEIALERTLTELLQGRKIENNEIWGLIDFHYSDQEVKTYENFSEIFHNGAGYYATNLFSKQFSYSFTEFETVKKKDNEQLLQELTNLIQNKGYNIFARDVSFLGLPSFHVVIPGITEAVPLNDKLLELINRRKLFDVDTREIMRNFPQVSTQELQTVIKAMQKNNFDNQDSIANFFSTQFNDSFLWQNIKTDLFIAAVNYKQRKFKQAYESMSKFVNSLDLEEEITTYYKCVRDYMGAKADGLSGERIKKLLATVYSSSIINKVSSDLQNPEEIFKYYGSLNCWNCSECMFSESCCYQEIKEIHMKLKDVYAENYVNQSRNKEIFTNQEGRDDDEIRGTKV